MNAFRRISFLFVLFSICWALPVHGAEQKLPSFQEILDQMIMAENRYLGGLTVSGTKTARRGMHTPRCEGPFTLSISQEAIALREEAAIPEILSDKDFEDIAWPAKTWEHYEANGWAGCYMRTRLTYLIGLDFRAQSSEQTQFTIRGRETEIDHVNYLSRSVPAPEPPLFRDGPYLYANRAVHALGRGFGYWAAPSVPRIDEKITRLSDGSYELTWTRTGERMRGPVQLVIDPNADYMVRIARVWGSQGPVITEVVSEGVVRFGDCYLPVRSIYRGARGESEIEYEYTYGSRVFDRQFYENCVEELKPRENQHAETNDNRTGPPAKNFFDNRGFVDF